MTTRNDTRRPKAGLPSAERLRHLHVAVEARRRYRLEGELFGLRGRLLLGDVATAHRLAARINETREAARFPELAVSGSELYAAVLLHELMHAVIEACSTAGRRPLREARAGVREKLGAGALEAMERSFVERFPPAAAAGGRQQVEAYLESETDGTPNSEVVAEEALLVWLANANPALERFKELFDDAPLRRHGVYERALPLMEAGLREGGPIAGGGMSLIDLLWAPQRRSPTSLEGQLRAAEELWGGILGERYAGMLTRLLRSIDTLHEGRARGPGGPGPAAVLDVEALAGQGEAEAYSADSDWMPNVVLIAKSTYVWLAQLERRFGREVRRLDQVPDEALDELVQHGFNALWLIGLWERSQASRQIKQRRGQAHAMASAYALYDYVVAADLGGEQALRELKGRAARRGIRLAGDMVPNHVGIDGRWVAEHPDWFIQLDHPPFPSYRFDGPDLSSHPTMAVRIEDHYWDDSDAAVVFQRADRGSGVARYIYHGNDGTSMPWNDTAQLDYLNPEAREAVIQTILHVARTVPIIRFDAAMTLAKRHVQRLWYPSPGHGGAIPSRSDYGGMGASEFERRMPVEFWREVVDRVASEAPDTLLLAEAFWMMEGYFVRTLGMHRVYNSAFMNMLKREENADYRRLMKNVLEFDPRILGRFVNFMNNPDEETAIAQFGDGDKYFGVAALMATLPGLPMFGHGQVEGFREKYGMEYRAPALEERPDPRLVDRHRREIAPLLHRRGHFANAETFRLFDVIGDDGSVQEDVLAFSNRAGGSASLVLYNNRYPRARGSLRRSAPFAEPWAGRGARVEALHEALGLQGGEGTFTVLRERRSGLEYLRRSDDLARDGLRVELDGFEARVFLDVRELTDRDGSLAGLHDELAGAGVPDLEEARLDWAFRQPRRTFVALLAAAAGGAGDRDEAREAARAFVRSARQAGRKLRAAAEESMPEPARGSGEDAVVDAVMAALWLDRPGARSEAGEPVAAGEADERRRVSAGSANGSDAVGVAVDRAGLRGAEVSAWGLATALRAALVLRAIDGGTELYGSLRLAGAVRAVLEARDATDPWAAARLPALLPAVAPRPAVLDGAALIGAVAREAGARELLGVHDHGGERWFVQERFRLLAAASLAYAAAAGATATSLARLRSGLEAAEAASDYRFDRLLEAGMQPEAKASAAAPSEPAEEPSEPAGEASRHEPRRGEAGEEAGGPGGESSRDG